MFYVKKLKIFFWTLQWCTSIVWSSEDLTPVLIPVVTTTYLGGSVHFICAKPNSSMAIAWDTSLIPSFFQTNNKNTSELISVVSSVSINNTLVSCAGRLPNEPSRIYYSNSVEIVLQGLLSKVDPSITMDPCSIQISWDPPFTLQDVPILGYNVNVTNFNSNTETSLFPRNSSINIPFGYDYNVSIAGVNGAGEGNISVIIIDKNLTSLTVTQRKGLTIFIKTIEILRNKTIWKISATVESALFCQNHSKLFYSFCQKNSVEYCFNTSDVSKVNASNTETVLSATVPSLREDKHYNYAVVHVIGNTSLSSNKTNISTFDVQSIEYRSLSNGSLCFNISYIRGSIATGCRIKLTCGQDIMINMSIDRNNNQWCSPILAITNGNTVCSLEAYDIDDNVENEPALELDITVSGAVTKSTSTINAVYTSTPTPTSNSGLNPVIYVIMAIVVVVVNVAVTVMICVICCRKLNTNMMKSKRPTV